jgi:hypothetical protein
MPAKNQLVGNDLLADFLATLDNVSAWARKHNLDDSTLCHLKKRGRNPSLAVAKRLEIATGGVVPMMSWPAE